MFYVHILLFLVPYGQIFFIFLDITVVLFICNSVKTQDNW